MEAEKLSEAMLYRDRPDSGDDRRLCLECKKLRADGCKTSHYVPQLVTVLQRCDGFELRGAA